MLCMFTGSQSTSLYLMVRSVLKGDLHCKLVAHKRVESKEHSNGCDICEAEETNREKSVIILQITCVEQPNHFNFFSTKSYAPVCDKSRHVNHHIRGRRRYKRLYRVKQSRLPLTEPEQFIAYSLSLFRSTRKFYKNYKTMDTKSDTYAQVTWDCFTSIWILFNAMIKIFSMRQCRSFLTGEENRSAANRSLVSYRWQFIWVSLNLIYAQTAFPQLYLLHLSRIFEPPYVPTGVWFSYRCRYRYRCLLRNHLRLPL